MADDKLIDLVVTVEDMTNDYPRNVHRGPANHLCTTMGIVIETGTVKVTA